MQPPLVTVLMPVYNGEKYLREAIDSILHQTFTDFELLIVDDGSTDASVDIIKSYIDKRIRLVQNTQNLGISATLNKGVELAAAALIARMDADDISYPDRLRKQFDFFTGHPECVFLSSWAQVITEEKVPVRLEKYNSRYYYYNMTFSCWIYHPTVMYRRSAVLDVGGYRSRYAEDYDLFWQLLRKYKIHHLEETLLDYRVTGQSLHQVVKKKEYDDAMTAQILRNIRFYAGDSFELSFEELQCLRFDFDPILRLNNLGAIVRVFRKLKLITKGMELVPNPNMNVEDIRQALFFRRRYMRRSLIRRLSPVRASALRILLMGT